MKSALFPVWTPRVERVRDAVNHWVRTSGEHDAIIDVDRVMADPADPADPDRPRLASVHEDGLHPSDTGYQAIARSIDLRAL